MQVEGGFEKIRTGLLRGGVGTQEIAPRVLSRELKALALNGLIDRKDYGLVPPKVEYRLHYGWLCGAKIGEEQREAAA